MSSAMMCAHANEVPVLFCPCREDCYCRSNTCKANPKYGDTQEVVCSWCHRRKVTEVFKRYPADTGLPGGYWDCSECPCGAHAGMFAMADAMMGMGRSKNHYSRSR